MISMNLSEVRVRESWREETERLIRDFERRNKRNVTTEPIVARPPEVRVDIVINPERKQDPIIPARRRGRPSVGKIQAADRDRVKAKMAAAKVTQQRVADALCVTIQYIGNILRGSVPHSRRMLDRIECEVDRIISANEPPAPDKRMNQPWPKRAELLALMKRHGISKAAVQREAGLPCNYTSEALRGDYEPSPERAEIIEKAVHRVFERKQK